MNTTKETKNHNISIKIDKNDYSIEDVKLHRLPFNIGHNGFAKVSNYFKVEEKPSIVGGEKKYLYSSFRGVKLVGENINLPSEFDGYVFRDDNGSDSASTADSGSGSSTNESGINNKIWEPISKFNNLTYWNRETLPSDFDKPIQAIKSLKILSMVNKEITEQDIQDELNKVKNNKGNENNNNNNNNNNENKPITTTTEKTVSPNKKKTKKDDDDDDKGNDDYFQNDVSDDGEQKNRKLKKIKK